MPAQPNIEPVHPLVKDRIATGECNMVFSTACFEGKHWSLAPLQKPEDVQKNLQLATHVGAALRGLGAIRAFAPNPTKFNGQIIRPALLNRDIVLPGGVHLLRNQAIPADGTKLAIDGDAGVFSAGGCAFIVATLGYEMYFAHAGRECVLDRHKVLTRGVQCSRKPESVVDNIVARLVGESWRKHLRSLIRVWVFYSIKPQDFAHYFATANPEHAAYNRAAAEFLPKEYGGECGWADRNAIYIDLPKIIRAQFVRHGIPADNISLQHAYLRDELPTTRNGGGRYLAVVVRH